MVDVDENALKFAVNRFHASLKNMHTSSRLSMYGRFDIAGDGFFGELEKSVERHLDKQGNMPSKEIERLVKMLDDMPSSNSKLLPSSLHSPIEDQGVCKDKNICT